MKTLLTWIGLILLFALAIRLAAWLVTSVTPLLASLAILAFLATVFFNGVHR